jgi:hypothetical protein
MLCQELLLITKSAFTDIFVIKTTTDKHVKAKRCQIYWCLVDLEKIFDSIEREVLVSENMVTRTKKCMKLPNFV